MAELFVTQTHLKTMTWRVLLGLAVVALLGACGTSSSSDSAAGVEGRVMLGPQCPVVSPASPCPDKPADGATVTVSQPGSDPANPGDTVTTGTTDSDGSYRIAVDPGDYVVTADAGMTCTPTPVTVADAQYISADITCDTGIR